MTTHEALNAALIQDTQQLADISLLALTDDVLHRLRQRHAAIGALISAIHETPQDVPADA